MVQSKNGGLPIWITGSAQGAKVSLDATLSGQNLTALLLVAPCMPRGIEIYVNGSFASKPYVELTIHEMSRRSVPVATDWTNGILWVKPQAYQSDVTTPIEGDASAAPYFAALATLHSEKIRFRNLSSSSLQGDIQFLEVCRQMGAPVEVTANGTLVQGAEVRRPIDEINMQVMPDVAPTLMAMAPFLSGTSRIAGLQTLRYKECDRISCPAKELRKAGIEGEGFVEIQGGGPYRSVEVDSYQEHRMAMSLAIFASLTPGSRIGDPHCVDKTYPRFWKDFASVRESDGPESGVGLPCAAQPA